MPVHRVQFRLRRRVPRRREHGDQPAHRRPNHDHGSIAPADKLKTAPRAWRLHPPVTEVSTTSKRQRARRRAPCLTSPRSGKGFLHVTTFPNVGQAAHRGPATQPNSFPKPNDSSDDGAGTHPADPIAVRPAGERRERRDRGGARLQGAGVLQDHRLPARLDPGGRRRGPEVGPGQQLRGRHDRGRHEVHRREPEAVPGRRVHVHHW